MATSCACKYKCGNAKITFNKDTVAKNEPFTMTIEPRKKQLDVTTNQLSSVPYTPENIFQISALGDGKAIGLHVPTYEWADNKAVIEGCYFTGDPPEGKLEVTVNISVTDPTPPSEGACGSASITLKKSNLVPNCSKTCSGLGDGWFGEFVQTNGTDWYGGADIYYTSIGEHFIGHVDYGQDATFGPMNCPYNEDDDYEYCTDATWTVTWSEE